MTLYLLLLVLETTLIILIFNMAISKTISRTGETREITLSGNSGAKFELYVKQGSNYYNFDTDKFQTAVKILKTEIPSNGVFRRDVVIPTVTSNTSYDFFVRPIGNTTSNIATTNEQKIGTLFQKGAVTATFTTTEDTTLSIAGTLTGGTLTKANTQLSQTGAVTAAGSVLVYIHTIPTWNIETGGAWTLSNAVKTTVDRFDKTIVYVADGTNIASGYSVTGENIIDKITVSAISGNKVTLSAAQRLVDGQRLIFSKNEWEFKNISAKAIGSGTASVTMSNTTEIQKVGIADITVELDIDEYVSVKPNAFPVNVNCPAGGNVAIFPYRDCTNFLEELGDIDANLSSKTFKVHSIPETATSSAAIRSGASVIGTLSLGADEAMGSAGEGSVTYTAHANQEAGDTDIFYYKTVDAQSSPVTSSTTQGKVTVTIV